MSRRRCGAESGVCEILGMSANVPTDIVFSFTGLIRRGGETGPHKDGWGIAFYEDRGLRLFHDPEESSRSKIAAFLQSYPIRSKIVVSHIRKANRGKVALKNTHPFVRELWGRNWVFTHCSNRLVHITRRTPFGRAQLLDADVTVDFKQATTEKDVVTILATRPLTGNENWMAYMPGEYRVWRAGETIYAKT